MIFFYNMHLEFFENFNVLTLGYHEVKPNVM
jgi:hypothetical protein